ncbi:hypothetical protein Goarm_002160 [Gossypium armourianum]|uniref:RNase H type-1 domain-containing protein n=1 Tax=Gossypium armourianum TaxID=34283 RepID=A0A7J9K7T7_9ROSI|nr:hypothetical protein [Gossypium armourianum]
MKDCLKARQVLEYGGENNKFLVRNYSRCIDWIEDVVRGLDNKAVSDFITILWNVWNSRNNSIFKGVEEGVKVTWEGAAALSRDFQIFNLLRGPVADGVNKEIQIEWAELQTMEESIKVARSNNWNYLELESDYASLVNRFNKRNIDLTMAIACWSYAGGFSLIRHLYCLLSLQLCASWCGVAYALMSSLVWRSDVLRYFTV